MHSLRLDASLPRFPKLAGNAKTDVRTMAVYRSGIDPAFSFVNYLSFIVNFLLTFITGRDIVKAQTKGGNLYEQPFQHCKEA